MPVLPPTWFREDAVRLCHYGRSSGVFRIYGASFPTSTQMFRHDLQHDRKSYILSTSRSRHSRDTHHTHHEHYTQPHRYTRHPKPHKSHQTNSSTSLPLQSMLPQVCLYRNRYQTRVARAARATATSTHPASVWQAIQDPNRNATKLSRLRSPRQPSRRIGRHPHLHRSDPACGQSTPAPGASDETHVRSGGGTLQDVQSSYG